LGILFSSILCTCPNQRNLCNLIVSVMVGFVTIAEVIYLLVNILHFILNSDIFNDAMLFVPLFSHMCRYTPQHPNDTIACLG
jgi:hypothetical protein